MVSSHIFLTVFSLLQLALGLEAGGHGVTRDDALPFSARSIPASEGKRWQPRPRSTLRRRGTSERPVIGRGGVELPLHGLSSSSLEKRSLDNGSVIALATAQRRVSAFSCGAEAMADDRSTYVVPIVIGSPAVGYPFQLDLGSSDLLLASTLCGGDCPASLGATVNPYYDTSKSSSTFRGIDANRTAWNVSFADGRAASGFMAKEQVMIGLSTVPDQVIGLINSTNLTLAEQQISGILGLGFPRLSVLARDLLVKAEDQTSSSVSSPTASSTLTPSTSTGSSPSASSSPTSSSSSYLPPLLESLLTTPHLPYPVFGLALSSPPDAAYKATGAKPSSLPARFDFAIGSLTLGGVSSLFVSDNATGATVDDIEWHEVVPFGRLNEVNSSSVAALTAVDITASQTQYASTDMIIGPQSSSTVQKRQDPAATGGLASAGTPQNLAELEDEEYLFWAIEMRNVSMNGTDIGLESTYASLGIPPIALLDAGFNGISGPISQVEKIFDQVPDARQTSTGQWAVPCDTEMTLGFAFGGRYVTLQPSDWMYAQIESSSFCLAWPLGTAPSSDGIDWQLGTPFLKKVYSVFSYGINGKQAPMVGFLPLENYTSSADSTASSSSSTSSSTVSASSSLSAASSSVSASTTASPYGPTPTTIIPFTATVTVATEIPNAVLTVPSYSTPSYALSLFPTGSSVAVPTIGLANASAYSISAVPIINMFNASNSTTTSAGGIGVGGGLGSSRPESGASVGYVWRGGLAVVAMGVVLSSLAILSL